jgi:hypothetical protein
MFTEGFLSSLRTTMASRSKESKRKGDDIPQRPWVMQYRQQSRVKDPRAAVKEMHQEMHRDAAGGMRENLSLLKTEKSSRPHKTKAPKSSQPLYENNMNKVRITIFII